MLEPEGTLQWETMRVRVGCEFSYESEAAVPMLMLVRPQPTDNRIEYEARWSDPELPIREYLDVFGNTCWRFTAPGGELRIRYDALVTVSEEPDLVEPNAPLIGVDELPDETLVYTLPSRYVESDLLVPSAGSSSDRRRRRGRASRPSATGSTPTSSTPLAAATRAHRDGRLQAAHWRVPRLCAARGRVCAAR